jgi:hypothetical protein
MNRYQVSFGNHLYKIKNKILGYKITDISNIDILVISCYDVTTLEERAISAEKFKSNMAAAQWSCRSLSNIPTSSFRSFSTLKSCSYVPKVSRKPLEYCCIHTRPNALDKWYLFRQKHTLTSRHLNNISNTWYVLMYLLVILLFILLF